VFRLCLSNADVVSVAVNVAVNVAGVIDTGVIDTGAIIKCLVDLIYIKYLFIY
jgi:hypothetical protein